MSADVVKFTQRGEFVMIDGFLIDISVSEDHTFEAEVTSHPVESGSTISDNIRPMPIKVSMTCMVTNTPLEPMRTRREALPPFAPGQPLEPYALAQQALAHLKKVWAKREPVTIRTSLGTFTNMAMNSLTVPRAADDGDALKFSVSFTQIVTVLNARTSMRGGSGTNGKGKGKNRLGLQLPSFKEDKAILWRKGVAAKPKLVFGQRLSGFWYIGGGKWGTNASNSETEVVYYDFIENPYPEFRTDELPMGVWYHTDKKTRLREDELYRLARDLARDRKQKFGGTVLGPEVGAYQGISPKIFPFDLSKSGKLPLRKDPANEFVNGTSKWLNNLHL